MSKMQLRKRRILSPHYISRIDFLLGKIRGKTALHLGCSSGQFIQDRLKRGSLLHKLLSEEAKELFGIDIDEQSLNLMNELGFKNLILGNVEEIDRINIDKKFDVIVAGDLLEHLSRPGAMLDGVKKLLTKEGELIVSTNNAFGLHYHLKRWTGTYTEHPEHVCFFSPETLENLFCRHGYKITEMYGAYTEPPTHIKSKICFLFGKPLFKIMPILSGTIVVVATCE